MPLCSYMAFFFLFCFFCILRNDFSLCICACINFRFSTGFFSLYAYSKVILHCLYTIHMTLPLPVSLFLHSCFIIFLHFTGYFFTTHLCVCILILGFCRFFLFIAKWSYSYIVWTVPHLWFVLPLSLALFTRICLSPLSEDPASRELGERMTVMLLPSAQSHALTRDTPTRAQALRVVLRGL